jgi:Spy/CpxP family protein refolding chaperone
MADLKAQLKITPAQEGAWTAYTAAMQPPANAQRRGPRMDRAEFAKLTTPQRIDRMEQFAAERQAQMKQRGDAVKAFYAQLTPEQQKVYDERAMRGGRGEGQRGGGRHGHHGMGPGPR